MAFNPNNDEETSERQIGLRLWVINHYRQIRIATTAVLIGISSIFWGYTLYGLADYWFITGPAEQRALQDLMAQLLDPEMLAARHPAPLAVEDAKVFKDGEKYDLVARVANPNKNWYVEFDYNFVGSDKELAAKRGFILPGEDKYLMNLGIAGADKPTAPVLVFSNVKWKRVDAHRFPDYDQWSAERLNLKISDKNFGRKAEPSPFSQADFKIRNATAYGYWSVDVAVLLLRGGNLEGVNFIRLERFASGEEKSASLLWNNASLAPTETQIMPSVNIFDPGVYMPPR